MFTDSFPFAETKANIATDMNASRPSAHQQGFDVVKHTKLLLVSGAGLTDDREQLYQVPSRVHWLVLEFLRQVSFLNASVPARTGAFSRENFLLKSCSLFGYSIKRRNFSRRGFNNLLSIAKWNKQFTGKTVSLPFRRAIAFHVSICGCASKAD